MALTEYELKIINAHRLNIDKSFPTEFINFFSQCKDYTMLSRERLYDLYNSIIYINKASIKGDIIEVGCWAGGSLALCALTVDSLSLNDVKIWGYDTFTGHPEPREDEYDIWGNNQSEKFLQLNGKDWAKVEINTVKNNLDLLGVKHHTYKLIKGKIEETSILFSPKSIAILRIDVDWYEPTIVALNKFFPLLNKNGILIIDDYGHHSGTKKAVDEYFSDKPVKFFHIDYSCISCVKL